MGHGERQREEPGEREVFRTGLHPMALSGALGLALFTALVVALLILHNDLPRRTEVQIAGVGVLVAALGSLPALLRWHRTAIVLTDRRLLVSAGAWRRRDLTLPLGEVVLAQDAGLTGRLLDHGTVSITGPGGIASSIGHVAHARELVGVADAQARRTGRRGGVSS